MRGASELKFLVAGLVVLPWAAFAVVRGFGLDVRDPLIAIVAFTPYAAATSVIPVVVALVLRRWVVAAVAVVVTVVLAAAVVPRMSADDQPAGMDHMERLGVLSVNLRDGRASAAEVLELVRSEDVDVLALIEVKPGFVEELDRRGRVFPHRRAEATSMLLSRRALTGPATTAGPDAEPAGTVRVGGTALDVEVVHPPPPTNPRDVRTWHDVFERLASQDRSRPRVVLGDFNATLDNSDLRDVLDAGYIDAADATGKGLKTTFVGRLGLSIAIDHVLFDERLAVRRFEVLDVAGTDHRAVFADLAVPATPDGQ